MVFCCWMKIAVKPAVTSSAAGIRPSSSRLLGLSTAPSVPQTARQRHAGRRLLRACDAGSADCRCRTHARWASGVRLRMSVPMSGYPVTSHGRRAPARAWWSMCEALRDRRGADRRAQRRGDRDGGAQQDHEHRQRGISRSSTRSRRRRGVVDGRIQRRPADLPDPRLRPARGREGRLRPRTTRRTATRSCSCASTRGRARRRCSRSRAI